MSRKERRAAWWAERVGHRPATDAERRRARLSARAQGADWYGQMDAGGYFDHPVMCHYHEPDSYTGVTVEFVARGSIKERCGDSIVACARPVTRQRPRERARGRKLTLVAPAIRPLPDHLKPLPSVESNLYQPVVWYDAAGEAYMLE